MHVQYMQLMESQEAENSSENSTLKMKKNKVLKIHYNFPFALIIIHLTTGRTINFGFLSI